MKTLFDDLRLSLRMLRKSPGTTLLAVTVLGLGIGANSAMFNLANVILFRPLAVASPEELAGAYLRNRETGRYEAFSYPDYVDLRSQTEAFTSLGAHTLTMVGLEEDGDTRRAFIDAVSSNWLRTFGVTPILGRDFLAAEERPGSDPLITILSHGLWQRRGARESDIGATIQINARDYTIVGVAPEGFTGTSALLGPDLWVPLPATAHLGGDLIDDRPLDDRTNRGLVVVGRLAPGFDLEASTRDVERVAALLESAYPVENENLTMETSALSRLSVSTNPEADSFSGALSGLLAGMAFVVLLVAALNLATVQGARTLARTPEIAVRLALGSGRWPVVRQLLVEGLVLSLAGGAIGLFVAWVVPRLIQASAAMFAPFQMRLAVPVDLSLIAATLLFCFVATLLFVLGPGLRASRVDLAQNLREGGRSADSASRRGLFSRANLPVLAEIALTLVLLISGGLFLKGAVQATRIEPGFQLAGEVLLEVDTSFLGWGDARGANASSQLLDRLRALPGVRSAEVAATVPFGMVGMGHSVQASEEPPVEEGGRSHGTSSNWVGPRYFETLAIPLLRGRTFRDAESERVAIVDEALAESLWPDLDPIGHRLRFQVDGEAVEAEIIGLVATVRTSLFDDSERSHLYLPFSQDFHGNHFYHLRVDTEDAAAALLPTVRETAREIDESLPVLSLGTLRSHLDSSAEVWLMKAGGRIFGAFGLVALAMAVAGVYGVRAYSVARRTQELGIRMALGSSVGDTLWLVLREGALLGAVGSAIGLLLALAAGRVLSGFLVNVSATDPTVFAGALVLMLSVVVAACFVPARRAARLDPLEALRHE